MQHGFNDFIIDIFVGRCVKWPLTYTKVSSVYVLSMVHQQTNMKFDSVFTRLWPKMTLNLHKNGSNKCAKYVTYTYQICPSSSSWNIVFITSNNLTVSDPKWPLTSTKTVGSIYLTWYTDKPKMRLVQTFLHEILCSQGLHHLTALDHEWPLT